MDSKGQNSGHQNKTDCRLQLMSTEQPYSALHPSNTPSTKSSALVLSEPAGLVAWQLYVPSCSGCTLVITSDVSPLSLTSMVICWSTGMTSLSFLNHLNSGVGTPVALQVNVTVLPTGVSMSLTGTMNLGASIFGTSSTGFSAAKMSKVNVFNTMFNLLKRHSFPFHSKETFCHLKC